MGLNRMIAGRQIRKRMECQAGNIRSLVMELQREGKLQAREWCILALRDWTQEWKGLRAKRHWSHSQIQEEKEVGVGKGHHDEFYVRRIQFDLPGQISVSVTMGIVISYRNFQLEYSFTIICSILLISSQRLYFVYTWFENFTKFKYCV